MDGQSAKRVFTQMFGHPRRVVLSSRGDAKHRTRNLEIPGSSLRDAPE